MMEAVRLTASFKLKGLIPSSLFLTYKLILQELLDYAHAKEITSFNRLKSDKYRDLRARYPNLPSHYIYTACQMACAVYRSFRKLRRRKEAGVDKPIFKKDVIMLDDHVFSIDLETWEASIATENGRIKFKLLHGTYHEKFREMRIGQAWLIKKNNEYYLNAVFRRDVEPRAFNGKTLAVDVNENNVAFGTEEEIVVRKTGERAIRVAYFLKRRKLQSKPRLNEKPIMAKYRGREERRISTIYHRLANEVVKMAEKRGCSAIILENLKNIRKRSERPRELNGRMNRWGFRKLQTTIEYKAKLAGLNVIYVKAEGTSSLCPRCRVRLSPSGYRLMKCPKCGLDEDRDVIAVRNLLQMHVPSSTVQGEGPPMKKEEGRPSVTEVTLGQNGSA